ncbi:HlyD family efflux transporter periplasmic adaptor subunit [Arenimonas alkanexedens]
MAQPLFRPEVMQARGSRWLGGIVLGQPLSLWSLTVFACFCASAVALVFALGDYTRRTRVAGVLVPSLGQAQVLAPSSGVLVDVRVAEGAAVAAGDVLAVLDAPRATLVAGDTARAVQAAITVRQHEVGENLMSQRAQLAAQRDGLAAQQAAARDELAQVERELDTRRRQQALAQATLDRFEALRHRQFVSDLQLHQQQAQVLELLAATQALTRQAMALKRLLAQLQQGLAEIPSRRDALDADAGRQRAALVQESLENRARGQAVITAPVAGVVSTLLALEGQSVQAGQDLLSVLPSGGRIEAHLLVPSRAVGFVSPGDAVLLRYAAFPFQKFGLQSGRVERISRSALAGVDHGGGREPMYRIVVALERQSVRAYGRDEALKPGMQLEADILGERRRLWEWAIEPLYALAGTVARAP